MTKSQVSKEATAETKKKSHRSFLRTCIRRRNCVYCAILSTVLLLLAVGGTTYLALIYSKLLGEISDARERQSLLKQRTDFDAFFHSVCPVFPNAQFWGKNKTQSLEAVERTYCNRYCENNNHMEFVFRLVKMNETQMMKNVKDEHGNLVMCPHFIELKTCHEKKRGYFCEKKKFPKDYVFHQNPTCKTPAGSAASTSNNDAAANAKCHPYLGICTGCNPF